jgi:hypothetical protein
LSSLDAEDVNELFGYVLPGYALAILAILLFRNYSPLSNLTIDIGFLSLAGFVVLAGLPIGFLWVNVVYHPVLWTISFWDYLAWDDFCNKIMSGLRRPQITRLEKPIKRALIERFFADLRDTHPRVAFYHAKHHTIRDLGWIIVIVPLLRLGADRVFNYVSGCVIYGVAVAGFLIWIFCLVCAHNSFTSTKQHLAFLTAQHERELIKSVTNALKKPYNIVFL